MSFLVWPVIFTVFEISFSCEFKFQNPSTLVDFSRLPQNSWSPDLGNSKHAVSHLSFSMCNKTHYSVCGNVGFCVVKNGIAYSSQFTIFQDVGGTLQMRAYLKGNDSTHTMEAKVNFTCSDTIGKPIYLEDVDESNITLLWATLAACSIKNEEAFRTCVFKHRGLLKPINLQPLCLLKYYHTQDNKGNHYYLNICGSEVRGADCGNRNNVAACKVDNKGETTVIAEASKRQAISNQNGLTLELRNKTRALVKIEIVCNPGNDTNVLNFKHQEENTNYTTFELLTSLACVKDPVECSFADSNAQLLYNISSLSIKEYNIYNKERNYVMSICKPLKNTLISDGTFVCLMNGTKCVNVGTLIGGPSLVQEDLILSSGGGDKCENKRHRSVMKFVCSLTDNQPLFERFVNCTHYFSWHTSVACPKVFAVGNDCKIEDKFLGHVFDFKPLHKPGDYQIISDDGHFILNVCGNLFSSCDGYSNASVCFIDENGKQHVIGKTALIPRIDEDHISFVLNGQCSLNKSSMVHIKFMCNYKAELGISHPEYVRKDSSCNFFFVWQTKLACAEYYESNCVVSDEKGLKYDFSSLSHTFNNTVFIKDHKRFFINVCKSIIINHAVRCSSNAGICLENLSEPDYRNRFYNLGQSSSLKYNTEKKVFQADYKDGEMCNHPGGEAEFHALITFVCDMNAKGDAGLELIIENLCYYEFQWKTHLACSNEEQSVKEVNSCKVFDPSAVVDFDLTSLTKKEYTFNTSSGDTFHLAICGSLNHTVKSGIGMCRDIGKGCENLGLGNANLYFAGGRLFLNYTEGENCTGNIKKHTAIEFICDDKDSGPYVHRSDECSFGVTLRTSLVCAVPCVTEGSGKQINISLLRDNESNYRTSHDGIDYFINVCQPLVPMPGLNCLHGSSVCRAVPKHNNMWSNVMDLGFPHYKPMLINQEVVLSYSTDSHCLHSVSQNVSSSLNFVCDPEAGKGRPVVRHIVPDCIYEFVWKTSVVCEDYEMKLTDISSKKLFVTSNQDNFVDLSSICNHHQYKVDNFAIHMCNTSSFTEVYKLEDKKQTFYGKITRVVFSYSENRTKIFISDGEECKYQAQERYNAVLHLVCSQGESNLSIIKEHDCTVEFLWKSTAGCVQRVHHEEDADISQASVAGIVIGVFVVIVACIILVCCRTSAHRNWCRRRINLLFNKTHRSEYGYALSKSEMEFLDISSVESL